jgi:predicted transcriptional regulator
MTITVSLSPETGSKLHERAAATGKDVPTLIREAVEAKLASEGEASAPSEMPYDRWKAAFDQWVASHQPVDHFVDDSRESIYDGRGE